MNQLPVELAHLISDYAAIWTILPWLREIEDQIPTQSIHWYISPEKYGEWKKQYLSKNPMAEDMLNGQNIDTYGICNNSSDWAMDIVESGAVGACPAHYFASNTNPRAIAIMDKHFDSINPDEYYGTILSNPSAIELIKSNRLLEKMNEIDMIYSNPSDAAFELIKHRIDRDIKNDDLPILWRLAANPAQWAINRLIGQDMMNLYGMLCRNTHARVISHITSNLKHLDDDDWHILNKNPSAIDILRANPHKVTCDIWQNPAIFEPTRRSGVLDILTELTW